MPIEGVMDHVTVVLVEPVTVAVNDCCWPALRLTEDGLTVTATEAGAGGVRVTVALADLVVSAADVAVTDTVCVEVIDAGAVNSPAAVIEPADGLIDHVTLESPVPLTEAVNCCD